MCYVLTVALFGQFSCITHNGERKEEEEEEKNKYGMVVKVKNGAERNQRNETLSAFSNLFTPLFQFY